MSKREYNIRVPFTGYFDMTVEAENEQEALDIAFSTAPDSFDDIINDTDHYEWSIHEKVTDDDFFLGMQNEVEIEEGELVEDEY